MNFETIPSIQKVPRGRHFINRRFQPRNRGRLYGQDGKCITLCSKSLRGDTLLTVNFSLRIENVMRRAKSRRDETLLTVDFSLRIEDVMCRAKSRRDDT
jgi:hypothetical protein